MRIYHRVVITAGISVFSGFNRYRQWTETTGIFRFERTNPVVDGEIPEALQRWQQACRNADPAAAREDPNLVSAEYSLLHALRVQRRLADRPHVTLIHTETLGGQAAVILLTRLVAAVFGASVQLLPVPDLDANNRAALSNSLGRFMEKVAMALDAGEPGSTCFAPVGGYKVMTSLGYLAGAYHGFPTAYLHEDKQILHEIPAIPIRIEQATLRQGAPLIRRLREPGQTLQLGELTQAERSFVDAHPYLFDRLDDLVDLNAFARFLAGRAENKALLGDRVLLSTRAWRAIGDANLRAYALGQLRELRKRLRLPQQFRGELHHEVAYENLRAADFALYKGAVNGDLVFYAAYRWDEARAELQVNRIWFDHELYEHDAKAGNGFSDYEDGTWRTWDDAAT